MGLHKLFLWIKYPAALEKKKERERQRVQVEIGLWLEFHFFHPVFPRACELCQNDHMEYLSEDKERNGIGRSRLEITTQRRHDISSTDAGWDKVQAVSFLAFISPQRRTFDLLHQPFCPLCPCSPGWVPSWFFGLHLRQL